MTFPDEKMRAGAASTPLYGEGLLARAADEPRISLAVMKKQGISDALIGDRYFVQAGYHVLLAEDQR